MTVQSLANGLSILFIFSKYQLLVLLIFAIVFFVSTSFISALIFMISFLLLTYFVVFFSWGLGEGMKYFTGNNSVRAPFPSSWKLHNSALCVLFLKRPPTEPISTTFKMARAWGSGQAYNWSTSYSIGNNIKTLRLHVSITEYTGFLPPVPHHWKFLQNPII